MATRLNQAPARGGTTYTHANPNYGKVPHHEGPLPVVESSLAEVYRLRAEGKMGPAMKLENGLLVPHVGKYSSATGERIR